MPGRVTPLVTGEYYHVFNRGSDKRVIFSQQRDYKRFRQTFYYYQFLGPKPKFSLFAKSQLYSFQPTQEKKLVDIICYCLMPNHFHFLVRQRKTSGISTFISQVSNSYTKYFNTKYKRIGPLLQGAFKAVLVGSDEQLLHVSRYIHLNPLVSGVTRYLDSYRWSSYPEYLDGDDFICSIYHVLSLFPSREGYKRFVEDQADYAKSVETLKHHLLLNDEV